MAACAPRSPLYRNAYLYKGVHVMPGSQMHKLIEDGKEKAAAELDRQITQNAENLLKRYKEEVFDHPKLPDPPDHPKRPLPSERGLVIPAIRKIGP